MNTTLNPRERGLAGCRWRASSIIAAAALLLSSTCPASPSTPPRHGGTLVVELPASALVLDPMKWKMGAADNAANLQIAGAVFDRLLTLDRFGRFQPALATEWSHDAGWRHWQFTLRPGVRFSDGSVLSSADVANALQELLSKRAVVAANGTHVALQFASAEPALLEQLASGRYFIYRRNADGTLLGTGAFFVTEPAPGGAAVAHYKLASNDHCWAGRPFVDGMDVSLGVPPLRQLFDLQLGKADLVMISPELVRRASQENLRVWTSAPLSLYALQVNAEGPAGEPSARAKDEISQALSLALDRGTMANVLLQKQAQPAASFLPQWLSGYAFLFGMENDVERARKIGAQHFAGAAAVPLRLRVDAAGDLAKLIAERVAINARQAGIPVQIVPRSASRESSAGSATNASAKLPGAPSLRLIVWRYSSLSDRAELDALISAMQLDSSDCDPSPQDAEQLFLRERRLLAERGLIPLVVLPEFVGLGASVRDWMPERWGEWHLADVWLDKENTIAPGVGAQP